MPCHPTYYLVPLCTQPIPIVRCHSSVTNMLCHCSVSFIGISWTTLFFSISWTILTHVFKSVVHHNSCTSLSLLSHCAVAVRPQQRYCDRRSIWSRKFLSVNTVVGLRPRNGSTETATCRDCDVLYNRFEYMSEDCPANAEEESCPATVMPMKDTEQWHGMLVTDEGHRTMGIGWVHKGTR